ncbi:MAG: FecR domain-containing protein [Candidatus Binatia bacterium]
MNSDERHSTAHRLGAHGGAAVASRPALALSLLALLVLFSRVSFALEVGTVAAVDGTAETLHGGRWAAATNGTAIFQGDEIRTGRPGRLRIVFQDDTVLTLSDDSHIVVNEQVFRPTRGSARSVIGLLRGTLNALVSEYYRRPGAAYEVRTATAVAGVRGTDFVVQYSARDDVTKVVGISGRVEVHGVSDPTQVVFITAREVTSIPHGRLPGPPRRLSDTLFRQYIQGMEFIGAGAAESLTRGNPLLAGSVVPKPDRAAVVHSAGTARLRHRPVRNPRGASGLIQEPPAVFAPGGRLRITL